MPVIRLNIEYDGTAYCGWQNQLNGLSVQACIENAIASYTGERIPITGAGRTDAGVHAAGQVAHFCTAFPIPHDRWSHALNTKLPPDIRIKSSYAAHDGFNAQYDAVGKHYRYTFYCNEHASALYGRYSWHVKVIHHIDKMQKAVALFEGTHDFSCFMAASAQTRTVKRTIFKSILHTQDNRIYYDVWGDGFLYNQVRIMAGTLYYIGLGKMTHDDAVQLLSGGDRAQAGPTAPPHGLCLQNVYYEREAMERSWTQLT